MLVQLTLGKKSKDKKVLRTEQTPGRQRGSASAAVGGDLRFATVPLTQNTKIALWLLSLFVFIFNLFFLPLLLLLVLQSCRSTVPL